MTGSDRGRRWGREPSSTVVDGHPCLVYRERPRSVAELLHDCHRWGGREVLVQGDRRVTATQHEHDVAIAASVLQRCGVRAGDRVLLIGPNDIDWVVAFWAVQVLGAVAALGNPWWSDAEVATAAMQVQPALVLGDRDVPGVRTIGRAALRGWEGDLAATLAPAPVSEDDLSVVMFTAGTTGAGKAVLMTQRAVVANAHNLLHLTGRLPDDLPADRSGTVSLLSVPLFHLGGLTVTLTTLISGGRMVFLDGRFDPGEVLRLIERERVRVWGPVPTMVSRVLEHPDFDRYDTSSVASVSMGGAAVSPQLRARIRERFRSVGSRVGSLYGFTEAGGAVAAGSGDDVTERPGTVGRALPAVELTVRAPDEDGVGEIGVRTPSAARGYLGDPEPLADPDGWIYSGDLGRIDDEGWLYVTGRRKEIVIRGGENVSSVHVEEALLAHPAVQEVAVVGLPHEDLGEEVGAAVVLHAGADVDAGALRTFARRNLGGYEVPTAWWFRTDPLPTGDSGKILRRRVREEWVAAQTEDTHG